MFGDQLCARRGMDNFILGASGSDTDDSSFLGRSRLHEDRQLTTYFRRVLEFKSATVTDRGRALRDLAEMQPNTESIRSIGVIADRVRPGRAKP